MTLLPTGWLAADESKIDVLIVVGPSTHPPGSHEVSAGGEVLKRCLETMSNVQRVKASVVHEWPSAPELRASVRSLVFLGDFFPPGRMKDSKQILDDIQRMADRGCGIACLHYATGLGGQDVAPDGDHPLLRWIGGYFANRSCPHHESFAKIFERATIEKSAPDHPICRGWKPFTLRDEPYYNNYFGKDGKPANNVTMIAHSMLPPDSPKLESVGWCVERRDGGRGFGLVMPHFYKNWSVDDLRMLILNGVVWTAKMEIPAEGVKSSLDDLISYGPKSVEPIPKN
jgi:type 1 glutamine amidotransferase